ncbi:MAG: response regulator transcription factor [Oscillospiraceae bacterium]|nr:response regulator transcription factor [Oscillospiraceae bacterium]
MPENLEKILIAEADKNVCDLLQLHLMNVGFGVVLANTADEALRKCVQFNPGVMILSETLPDKNGGEVCREVRRFSDVAIIMTAHKEEEFDKISGLEFAVDDYLIKPFELETLCEKIKAIFRRINRGWQHSGSKKSKTVEHDKLRIDMNRYELWLDGEMISTPPKELELLFYLVSSPNKVFTRDQLLDDVWGFEYYGDSRTIDVHIRRIRNKLSKVTAKWKLKTVWGVGYKFETVDEQLTIDN